MNNKYFLISALLLVLSTTSVRAFSVAEALDFARLHHGQYEEGFYCHDEGAANPWYSQYYHCWQTSNSQTSHCHESMYYHYGNDYNCVDYVGSDCANFLSQILQAGCHGICEHYFNWNHGDNDLCDQNETIYYGDDYNDPDPAYTADCNCEHWGCRSNSRQVFQRARCWLHWSSSYLWGGLLYSDYWNGVAPDVYVMHPGDVGVCLTTDYRQGEHVIVVMDTWDDPNHADNGTWPPYYYGHTHDRGLCNAEQCPTSERWVYFRSIFSQSIDPLYGPHP